MGRPLAKRCSPALRQFYDQIRQRRETGKAVVATARKLLTIVYYTPENHWTLADFAQFQQASRQNNRGDSLLRTG